MMPTLLRLALAGGLATLGAAAHAEEIGSFPPISG